MIGATGEAHGGIENTSDVLTSVEDIKLMLGDLKVCQLPAYAGGTVYTKDMRGSFCYADRFGYARHSQNLTRTGSFWIQFSIIKLWSSTAIIEHQLVHVALYTVSLTKPEMPHALRRPR